MRLFRFAIISILGEANAWREFSVRRAGAVVRVIEAVADDNGLALFVCADVPLKDLPRADQDGLVEVPDRPRGRGRVLGGGARWNASARRSAISSRASSGVVAPRSMSWRR